MRLWSYEPMQSKGQQNGNTDWVVTLRYFNKNLVQMLILYLHQCSHNEVSQVPQNTNHMHDLSIGNYIKKHFVHWQHALIIVLHQLPLVSGVTASCTLFHNATHVQNLFLTCNTLNSAQLSPAVIQEHPADTPED